MTRSNKIETTAMFRTLSTTALALALSVGASVSAHAQDMFLNDALSVTNAAPTDILIQNGQISAMGANLKPPDGVEVIDNPWVSPGLVAPMSTLGLVDIGAERSTNDISSTTEHAGASIRASDGFNPRNVHIANARRRGIVYAVAAPSPAGETIFAGLGLTAVTDGSHDSVLNDAAFLHIALGQNGANRAGGSRGAAMAQLRDAIDDARRPYTVQHEGAILSRRDIAVLRSVLRGNLPLLISASRASDLLRIVDLKSDLPDLDIIIVGAEEAYLVADELADAGIKIIIDPHENLPDNFDSVNATFDNANIVHAAGVEFAIANLSSLGVSKAGNLNQHAGNAVGNGLPRDVALAAITTVPAGWFGLELGTMAEGEAANLIVWDGDPLDAMSAPIAIYRDGESLSLESRMTALRDRYNPLRREDVPHKYR